MSDDIVARLRGIEGGYNLRNLFHQAADEIERLRKERDELAARRGDHGPGAHTAGPVETFIPEAL